MKDLRIPGVVWVILLLTIGVLIRENAVAIGTYLHVGPFVVGAVVAAIFVAAKVANPGGQELNQAIDVIQKLMGQPKTVAGPATPSTGMRSGIGLESVAPTVREEEIPERPNKVARILIG